MFTHFFYLKFDAPDPAVEQLWAAMGAHELLTVGQGPSDYQVVDIDREQRLTERGRRPPRLIRTFRFAAPHWFAPEEIVRGKAWVRYDDAEAIRLQVFWDQEAGTVFLNWSVS